MKGALELNILSSVVGDSHMNQFDIVSDTLFSRDTVSRDLWLAILSSVLCPHGLHFRCVIGSWGRTDFGKYSRGCSRTVSLVFEQSESPLPVRGLITLVTRRSAIFKLCRLRWPRFGGFALQAGDVSVDSWFREIHVPRAWCLFSDWSRFSRKHRAYFGSIGARLWRQPPTLPLYHEGKVKCEIYMK